MCLIRNNFGFTSDSSLVFYTVILCEFEFDLCACAHAIGWERVRGRQSQWCVLICLIDFPLDGASQRPTGKPQSASAILHTYVFYVYYVCVCVLFACLFCLRVYSVCVCVFSTCVCIVCTLCIVCALYNFFHSHLLLQLLLLRDVAGVAAFVTGDKQTGEGLGVLKNSNNNCCLDSM